jgi:hypothetical protein
MKYWIFQSNQVLGPYEIDDLSRHSTFGAESLVCPEGRRGTSMGDWQRAGMVPDLSVALVRASQSNGAHGSVATLAGLPPEPTLKDLAVLGSLQEKMGMMEDVVRQLQEGLRLKDAELAALHQELAGKERQASVMKSAMEHEASDLKAETEERKREAEALRTQTDEFKRKMTEFEDRVGAVNRLNETIDKAVEAEKNVQHDVEAQGATIAELMKEIEGLRAQMTERLSGASFAMPAPSPAFSPEPTPVSRPAPYAAPRSSDVEIEMIPAGPSTPADPPEMASTPMPALPAYRGGEMPAFAALEPQAATMMTMPIDPTSGSSSLASPASVPDLQPAAAADAVSAPAAGGRKKGLIFGVLFGLVALAAIAYVSGGMGKRKSTQSESLADTTPLPTPALTPPPPVVTAPPPPPTVDPREAAIEAAKNWDLTDGRRLGAVLETLSPPVGNLSPWMAEPLNDDRVSVNYFAHGGGSGAPTVAYEFEVDLAAKTVAGRNPAAKAVIAGKAAAPPAPPKAKRITLKRKAKAPAKPKEDLDSLLGTETAPKAEATLAGPGASPTATPAAATADAPDDSAAAPADDAPAPAPKPTTAKRAAKAAAKSAASTDEKAADETLLDDVLKE